MTMGDPILDKCTSALDPKNEVIIPDAVQIPGARQLLPVMQMSD
jgi:ABC-type multidrug transport system fused ATPase/permease subunit